MGLSVACAVLRGDPPTVFLAEDLDALLGERWADAVLTWMDHADVVVDVYPSVEVASVGDRTVAAAELQFTPLFASGS